MSETAPLEPGAPAVEGAIPLCVPYLSGNERRYVEDALATNWVSSAGPYVSRFEKMVGTFLGVGHAVATVNGTAALHIALLVAGVEPDDAVIVPAMTFIAPVNAIRYANAWPVFLDAEEQHAQLDPVEVERFLREECALGAGGRLVHRATNRRVKAMLTVNVIGHPCDYARLRPLADEFGIVLIEDATESLGSNWNGRRCGAVGDIAALSFNGNKLITTGGGGMLLTRNENWARRARYLTTQAKDDAAEFIHGAVGYNYRLSNLNAAVGCAQMEQLHFHILRKREIAARYDGAFAAVRGLRPIGDAPWAESSRWMYTMQVSAAEFGMSRRALGARMAEEQIQTRPLWQAISDSPAFRGDSRIAHPPCPMATRLHETTLSLPCSVGLTKDAQERVIAAVLRATEC